LHGFLS